MRVLFEIFLIVEFCLTLQACVTKGTSILAVGSPHFVPQSEPDAVSESGIAEDTATVGIFLQWDATWGAAGYKLYRSDTTSADSVPFDFSIVANITSSLGDTSTVDRKSILIGVRYYYYLIAYGTDGSLSESSDTINYLLFNRPKLGTPVSGISVSRSLLHFSWSDPTSGGYTVIRLKDISVIPPATIWVSKRFEVFEGYPDRLFDFDSTAVSDMVSGETYQWRVDRFFLNKSGRPWSGSRSVWGLFTLK